MMPLSVREVGQGVVFAWQRDERIAWLLEMHPVTAAMLTDIGWFPSVDKARRRLRRLVLRRKVRLVGTVCRKDGRPEHVYCRWQPKVDQMLHEVQLTQVCLRLHAGILLRGPLVRDLNLRPDAEIWINGDRYCLELDRATSGYDAIVHKRFGKYEGCRDLSLWVCPTEVRREGMRQRASQIGRTALFTTLSDALSDPHGPIWLDVAGERAALPREGR